MSQKIGFKAGAGRGEGVRGGAGGGRLKRERRAVRLPAVRLPAGERRGRGGYKDE